MKPSHLLVGLFAIASLLLDLVVATGLEPGSETVLMLFLGLVFGQLALLGIWCAMGSCGRVCSFSATALAAAICSIPLGSVTVGRRPEWFTVMCLFALGVALATLIARFRSAEVTIQRQPISDQTNSHRSALQFSLRGTLSTITAIAIILGVVENSSFPWPHVSALAGYGSCLILVVAVVAFWAGRTNAPQPLLLRIATVAGLCLLAAWMMCHIEHARSVSFFATVNIVEASVVWLGLTVWRMGEVELAAEH